MLPNVPTERRVPTRVANFSGGNLNMKTFIEPIRIEAIPTPIRILPKRAEVNEPHRQTERRLMLRSKGRGDDKSRTDSVEHWPHRDLK